MFALKCFSKVFVFYFLSLSILNASNFFNTSLQFSDKKKLCSSLAIVLGSSGLVGLELKSPHSFPWFRVYSFLKTKKREEFWKKNSKFSLARKGCCGLMCAGVVARMYAQY